MDYLTFLLCSLWYFQERETTLDGLLFESAAIVKALVIIISVVRLNSFIVSAIWYESL